MGHRHRGRPRVALIEQRERGVDLPIHPGFIIGHRLGALGLGEWNWLSHSLRSGGIKRVRRIALVTNADPVLRLLNLPSVLNGDGLRNQVCTVLAEDFLIAPAWRSAALT